MTQLDRKLRGILIKAGLVDEDAARGLGEKMKEEGKFITEMPDL